VAAPLGSPALGVIMHASISRSRHSRATQSVKGVGLLPHFARLWFRAQPPTRADGMSARFIAAADPR
jgi:hypothetical protein